MNKLFVLSTLAVLAFVSAAPSGENVGDWKKISVQPIQECKVQENASDDDLKIFENRNQMPINEKQSCLLTCLDSKLGLMKNNKLDHEGFMKIAKGMLGDSKEKQDEAENIFKKCEPEVAKKSAEKCGTGTAMRACIIELSNIH